MRLEKGGNIAYVALAAPVPGSTSVKVNFYIQDNLSHVRYGMLFGSMMNCGLCQDAVACMLLQRILGTGSHVKWGGSQGKLAKAAAAASAANQSVAGIQPLGVSHQDYFQVQHEIIILFQQEKKSFWLLCYDAFRKKLPVPC